MATYEKVITSLWILVKGMGSSWRSLVDVVCMVPFIVAIVMLGGNTSHPLWVRRGWSMVYLFS